jgi:hypothetical protein
MNQGELVVGKTADQQQLRLQSRAFRIEQAENIACAFAINGARDAYRVIRLRSDTGKRFGDELEFLAIFAFRGFDLASCG